MTIDEVLDDYPDLDRVAAYSGRSRGHDPCACVDRHVIELVAVPGDVDHNDARPSAAGIERAIERAVGQVARECEVAAGTSRAETSETGDDDPAGSVEHGAEGLVGVRAGTDRGEDLAAVAEAGVELSVGEVVQGSDGGDFVTGDTLEGSEGNDVLVGASDFVDGGEGNEEAVVGDGLFGENGSATTCNTTCDDVMTGGNDTLESGDGLDYAIGDGIFGGPGTDTEDLGDDTINGADGDDHLEGDDDNPFNFPAQEGAEISNGGDDVLNCGEDEDFANGGPGTDTAAACEATQNVEIFI